jgi:predicted nucleotidyltransferase
MPADIQRLVKEFKEGLAQLYGSGLQAVYIYGSYARGDYSAGSDVDVMIVLEHYKSYWEELGRSAQLASDLSLKYNLTISRVYMTQQEWQNADTPLLRNIHAEGQAA